MKKSYPHVYEKNWFFRKNINLFLSFLKLGILHSWGKEVKDPPSPSWNDIFESIDVELDWANETQEYLGLDCEILYSHKRGCKI